MVSASEKATTIPQDELAVATSTANFARPRGELSYRTDPLIHRARSLSNRQQLRWDNSASARFAYVEGVQSPHEQWAKNLAVSASGVMQSASGKDSTSDGQGVLEVRAAEVRRSAVRRTRRSLGSVDSLPPGARLTSVTKWEGRVIGVDVESGTFTTDLQSVTDGEPNLYAEFGSETLGDDFASVRIGSVVYVTVLMVRDRFMKPRTQTTLRLQRLGRWTAGELEEFMARTNARHEQDADLFD